MICVNKCSFLKKENNSLIWYCSLYNKNLLSDKDNIYVCHECYEEEIKILKEKISDIYKIKDILKRL